MQCVLKEDEGWRRSWREIQLLVGGTVFDKFSHLGKYCLAACLGRGDLWRCFPSPSPNQHCSSNCFCSLRPMHGSKEE
jgi:hypothetical protein